MNPNAFQTYCAASRLADRGRVWAALRNGFPLVRHGEPVVLTAVSVANTYARTYAAAKPAM